MTPATGFAGRRVALFGLGGSGLATALSLQAGGAELVAFDDSPASLEAAAAKGIATADLRGEDWSRFEALVLSPGVPLTHPEPHWTVPLARAAGVEIIGDIEIFCRERARLAPGSPFVAITGTNGKSTTTALVAHILRQAGRDVQMGGNIGTPVLALEPASDERVHVVEMSSFQIDLTPSLKPSIGVLLNISPDHLDRHGTIENYAAIKARLVMSAETALVSLDDSYCREIAIRRSEQDRLWNFSVLDELPQLSPDDCMEPDFFALGTKIYIWDAVWFEHTRQKRNLKNEEVYRELADVADVPSLRGRHSAQNAAAAVAATWFLEGVYAPAATPAALRSFPGLPHRMEEVGRLGRVLFVNDSKATNADSAAKALASFDRIHWILGGQAKEGGIEGLKPYFTKIEKAYLIGAASDAFAATLEGEVPFTRCETLDRAVAAASEGAGASGAPEAVVLLSPACASYDQFRNFEIRGDRFRELVKALPGVMA